MTKDPEVRAQMLSLYLGDWPANEYSCFICREQGREAVYDDWPHAVELNTGWLVCQAHRADPRVTRVEELPVDNPMAFQPDPAACRNCGTILYASYAGASKFTCPGCGELACFICGCTETRACVLERTQNDGTPTVTRCYWLASGTCAFCGWRAAYEYYQAATRRAADDPFYMSLGRAARAPGAQGSVK